MDKQMRHVIIPDVHEKVSRFESILAHYDNDQTHFVILGDYFDSFTHDISDVRRLCQWVNSAAMQPEKYTLLLGNHDIQYLVSRRHMCTGYQADTAATIAMMLSTEARRAFRYHYWIGADILCSHAGLSRQWVDDAFGIGDAPAAPSVAEIRLWLDECAEQFLHSPASGRRVRRIDPDALFTAVGTARGGHPSRRVGGITWCDWNAEFEEVPGVRQIVGHTTSSNRQPMVKNINWCIDTNLRHVAIVDETGTIRCEEVIL
jgi:hypothetical protein